MIALLGILGPYVSVNHDWRWIYWGTSSVGIVAWILLILFVPETRKQRSMEELSETPNTFPSTFALSLKTDEGKLLDGQQLWPVQPGESRTALDYATYGRRRLWDDVGFFQYGYLWKESGIQIIATLKSLFFPGIIWCILLQTAFGIVMGVTIQAVSFALLASGYAFIPIHP